MTEVDALVFGVALATGVVVAAALLGLFADRTPSK